MLVLGRAYHCCEKVTFARMTAEKDGLTTEFLTSEGARAARLLADFESIARELHVWRASGGARAVTIVAEPLCTLTARRSQTSTRRPKR